VGVVLPVTVAVSTTDWPTVDGEGDATRVVAVDGGAMTVATTSAAVAVLLPSVMWMPLAVRVPEVLAVTV
jgi:hypothetical protein